MSAADRIERGLALHLAGRLADAAAEYRGALEADPDDARAWHLLGEIDRQGGDLAAALDKLDRAVALDPALAEAHNARGLALKQAGRFEEAAASFTTAAGLVPGFAEAWSNLGDARRLGGDADGAIEACRKALEIDPGMAGAHNNLGLALAEKGETNAAATALAKAIALAADATPMRINLAEIERAAGRLDDALAAAEKAVAFAPGEALAHNALGNVLFDRDEFAAAESEYARAAELAPDLAAAHSNLGNALQRQDRPADAIPRYRRALELDPGHVDALVNLGAALQAHGEPADALGVLDRAVALAPGNADAHWNRALVKLQLGDLSEGFAEYEWRWKLPQFAERPVEAARWRGEDLNGKSILIHSEQGFGDTIWALRYAKLLAERGAEVVVETHAPLLRLAATARGVVRIVEMASTPKGGMDGTDFHLPVMSLPAAFETGPADIPAEVPYLSAPEGTAVPAALGGAAGFKVGIAWSGRPTQRQNRMRSCPLAQFEAVAEIGGITLFSLQVGEAAEDLKAVPWGGKVADLAPGFGDFADTAAAMMELDLVITVDTAVAHLAGALARPVWVLLSHAPDWRYGVERDDHPWYPTMRLFRQAVPGDWAGVMAAVRDALRSEAG